MSKQCLDKLFFKLGDEGLTLLSQQFCEIAEDSEDKTRIEENKNKLDRCDYVDSSILDKCKKHASIVK